MLDGVGPKYPVSDHLTAALAGAPCFYNLSQNVDACGTSFGHVTSAAGEREQQITVSVSVSVGVQHPDPIMVGHTVTVYLPHEPVLVERGYFNDAQPPGALLVDDAVFQHTVGEPSS